MEYKNIVAPDPGNLDKLVNEALTEGWELWGSMVRLQVQDPRKVVHSVDYVQTVIKDAAKADRIATLETALSQQIKELVETHTREWKHKK